MKDNKVTFDGNSTVSLSPNDEDKELFGVSGWAIHPGLFKGEIVEFPEVELQNAANSLINKQLTKNHEFSTDAVVGMVKDTKIQFDPAINLNGVRYFGEMRDAELEQKIKDGFIYNVSIGFELTPECSVCHENFFECEHWFDEAHVIARDVSCYELSFVMQGADGDTTIEPALAFSADTGKEEFMAQFANKRKTGSKPIVNQSYTGDTNTYIDDFGNVVTPIIIPNTWTTGTSTSFNNQLDGDKVTELEQKISDLTERLDAAESKIDELKAGNEELEGKLSAETQAKEEAEQKVSELQGEIEEKDTKIEEFEQADEVRAQEAKEAFCVEIVGVELEKGMLQEEGKEARFEELKVKEMPLLEEIKSMADRAQKVEGQKPGRFDNEDRTGTLETKDKVEFDMNDKELRDKMFRAMYRVPDRK